MLKKRSSEKGLKEVEIKCKLYKAKGEFKTKIKFELTVSQAWSTLSSGISKLLEGSRILGIGTFFAPSI